MDLFDEVVTEAKTDDRANVPVVDLEHMALNGDETPVSGDALRAWGHK